MNKIKYLPIAVLPFVSGCSGALGDVSSDNAIERGLSYIAAAIVTHAIISLFR